MKREYGIQDDKTYISNVSMRCVHPSNIHTCDNHRIFFQQHLCSTRKITKRCIDCLKTNVKASIKKNQVVIPEYNYIFPMICDNCSIKLQKCKWCRPLNHKFIASY